MNVGKVIKQLRVERGLSQLSLGLSIGNDAAYISRIENNRKEPSLKILLRLAEVLEVEPIELFRMILESE